MRYPLLLFTLLVVSCHSLASGEEPTKREVSLVRHWLSNTSETRIHQLRGASENKMYLHKDGHKEAVYDRKGKLVKDGINDGSYNYAHPVNEPFQHFNKDILPWIVWGNSRTDPTKVKERLEAYSVALGQGLGKAQTAPRKAVDGEPITKSELRAVEFFLRVLEEGGVGSILQILEDPKFEVENPKAIGMGLTKGLIAVVERDEFEPVKP